MTAAISPYREVRDERRASAGAFVEVYVDAPLAGDEARDVKGLYRKHAPGHIPHFHGCDGSYDPPRDLRSP